MDESQNNYVSLCGVPGSDPVYSHESRSDRFFTFPLEIARLSGTMDRIPIVLRESQLERLPFSSADRIEIEGELRSFNNRSGIGRRLVISVFAREIGVAAQTVWKNSAELSGTLCRSPVYRSTPMGREITDIMLAVNRPYGRSDYLPCIAWGRFAREASVWDVGTRIHISGRIQSREYIKNLDGEALRRVAYEVSATEITPID